jgi:hypothetical protein
MLGGASKFPPPQRAPWTFLLTRIPDEVLPHNRTTWMDLAVEPSETDVPVTEYQLASPAAARTMRVANG